MEGSSSRVRRLIEVNPNTLTFKISTAYKWHSQKRYPKLLFKGLGGLLIDLDELDRMFGQSKEMSEREAQRIHREIED